MENLEKSNQNPEEILNPVEETQHIEEQTDAPVAEVLPETETVVAEAEPVAEPVTEVSEPVEQPEEIVAEETPAPEESPVEEVAAIEEPVVAEEAPVAEENVPAEEVTVAPEVIVAEEPAPAVSAELDYLEQVSLEDQQDKEEMVSELADLQMESGMELHHDEDDEHKHEEAAVPEMNFDAMSREELVELLEQSVQEDDLGVIKNRIAFIKVAFLKATKELRNQQVETFKAEGGNIEEYEQPEDQLEERFKKAFNVYRQNRIKFNEDQEKVKLDNLEAKKLILEDLKNLIASDEGLKKTYDEFKALQDKWKEIGMVPKSEANTLWQNYHFLVEKFFDKVKISNELKDLDLKKNLEAKMLLCEKAEALLIETSILKSFKQLQQYHDEWKEIGPVPQDKKDEIWNRFKDATDKINDRRREYYEEIKGDQENNLMAKNALCEQAEKITSEGCTTIKQWQDATTQLTELQKVWRTIGPAPKASNEAVWQRFKTAVDSFFNVKKEYFGSIKEEQQHNFNLKLDLCVQAEAIKDSTEWKKTSTELIHLQEEWKKIGPVPRKHSDKIWKRFRAACDEFFSAKSAYFSNIQATEQENMKRKEELILKVKEYQFTEDRKENLEILNGFQREFTEIGHVPIKEKERLQSEFRKSINAQLDKLKISANEMTTMEYRHRFDSVMRDSPDMVKGMSKEKVSMSQRIKQLQEDIKLWENNIGFLANSKSALILKEEFMKKIQKSKDEVKLLEAKLKMLREN